RKAGRAALTAAGAVVVLAGAITVPRLILNGPAGGTPVAGSGTSTPARPSSTGPGKLQSTGTPGQATSSPTPTPTAPPPVPPNFAASSVTFVSTSTGWVIGQAGTPGHCGPPDPNICTSVARTSDGGRRWLGRPAPGSARSGPSTASTGGRSARSCTPPTTAARPGSGSRPTGCG